MKIKFRPTKVVLIAFVFLLLYYPPILPINMMHVLTVISVLYLLRYRNKNISRILSGYSFPFFILSMYLLIVILLNGESISNVTPVLMLGIETVPVCLAIADMKTRKVSDVDIFDIIISAAMIQSLIAFATFFVPSLHELLINQYTNYGYGDIIIELSGYRMYGLSYGLTYGMPVANACIATIALYRGVNHDNKYFIKALLIFAAAVINARTSIVIFAIGLVGVVLSSIKDYKKAAKIVFYIVIALLLFSQVLVYLDSYAPETAEWIRHGIEDITTFITGKDSNEYSYFSYATSKSKYSVPSDIMGFLFGTGSIAMGSGTSHATDVGFINDIWLGGVVYCIGITGFVIRMVKRCFKTLEKERRVPHILFFIAIAMLLAADIKGICFSLCEVMQLVILCAIFFRYEELQNRKMVADTIT